MKVIPSIDLLDGKVVRLFQGDYHQVTVYYEHPFEAMEMLKRKGAKRIHIVDLNGAREEERQEKERQEKESENFSIIRKLVEGYKDCFEFQVGGGIRSIGKVEKLLEIGVGKVVIGSLIFTNHIEYEKIIEKYENKVILALDVKDGLIRRNGWLVDTKMTIKELLETGKIGRVFGILTTDINVDGGLTGPNIQLMKSLTSVSGIRWIASGGVSSRDDLEKLSKLDLYGAILGKSIFENLVDDLSDL